MPSRGQITASPSRFKTTGCAVDAATAKPAGTSAQRSDPSAAVRTGSVVKKPMTMPALTRGDRAICWIAKYCLYPDGPHKGKPVRLSEAECWQVRQLYDNPNGPDRNTMDGVARDLGAFAAR